MQWLPRVEISTTPWRLPLGPGTATRLVEAIMRAGSAPLVTSDLTEVLARDPALCLWVWTQARVQGCPPADSVAQLAAWLASHWRELVLSEPVDSPPGDLPAGDEQQWFSELACRSVAAACRAAELAQAKGLVAEQAYLLALLHRAADWVRPELPGDFARFAPGSDPASPLATCIAQAWQQTEDSGDPSKFAPAAELARADWLRPPLPEGLLWYLVSAKQRLSDLEQRFSQQLEAAKLESLKELAYGAGHEINNPLANISARAQTLLRDEAEPARRRLLASIHSQAIRAHEMIADMMLFARPPRPTIAAFDVSELLRQLAAELAPWAEEQHTELLVAGLAQPLIIEADRNQIAVALRALCVNSLEALVSGGQIEVTLSASEAGGARIIVSDTGPGIPPEARTRIFDPYYSGREAGRGLGLGLSKCWRIVTQHGGQIELEDSPGPGARFVITLPAGNPR